LTNFRPHVPVFWVKMAQTFFERVHIFNLKLGFSNRFNTFHNFNKPPSSFLPLVPEEEYQPTRLVLPSALMACALELFRARRNVLERRKSFARAKFIEIVIQKKETRIVVRSQPLAFSSKGAIE